MDSSLNVIVVACTILAAGFIVPCLWHYTFKPEMPVPPIEVDTSQHPIAVIIPALNEAKTLPRTVTHLLKTSVLSERLGCPEPAVIVVDGGSKDGSDSSLQPLMLSHPGVQFITHCVHSRGAQQNVGARQTSAQILLFLHADTLLPSSWDATILSALSTDYPPALGTFTLSLPSPISWPLKLMLTGANLRARFAHLPYGDQAYFLRRSTFNAIGGFPNVPIMEDVELLRRVRHFGGRLAVLDDCVVTSPRRWVKKGVFWNTLLNQTLVVAWMCGVSQETIYGWYYGRQPSE